MTITASGVRCGNHTTLTYHASVAEVRDCCASKYTVADYLAGRIDVLPDAAPAKEVWLVDVVEGRATMEEYVAARMDLSPEDRRKALQSFDAIGSRDTIVEYRPASEGPATKDGIYRNPATGQIFKVYHTVHGANQRVAKELVLLPEADWYTKVVRGKEVTVKAEFVYRGKAGLVGLTAGMKMSLEEGKKYGAIYGVCVRCAATLTREESIERAMGPVCAGKDKW